MLIFNLLNQIIKDCENNEKTVYFLNFILSFKNYDILKELEEICNCKYSLFFLNLTQSINNTGEYNKEIINLEINLNEKIKLNFNHNTRFSQSLENTNTKKKMVCSSSTSKLYENSTSRFSTSSICKKNIVNEEIKEIPDSLVLRLLLHLNVFSKLLKIEKINNIEELKITVNNNDSIQKILEKQSNEFFEKIEILLLTNLKPNFDFILYNIYASVQNHKLLFIKHIGYIESVQLTEYIKLIEFKEINCEYKEIKERFINKQKRLKKVKEEEKKIADEIIRKESLLTKSCENLTSLQRKSFEFSEIVSYIYLREQDWKGSLRKIKNNFDNLLNLNSNILFYENNLYTEKLNNVKEDFFNLIKLLKEDIKTSDKKFLEKIKKLDNSLNCFFYYEASLLNYSYNICTLLKNFKQEHEDEINELIEINEELKTENLKKIKKLKKEFEKNKKQIVEKTFSFNTIKQIILEKKEAIEKIQENEKKNYKLCLSIIILIIFQILTFLISFFLFFKKNKNTQNKKKII